MDKQGPEGQMREEFKRAIDSFQKATEERNTEQAEAAAVEMLALAAAEAEQHPSPDSALFDEATECESRGDWAGAESARQRILALHEAAGNEAMVVKPRLDLSQLYLLLGRTDDALREATLASAAARLIDLSPLQVMALENEVACHLLAGQTKAANQVAEEIFTVIEPGAMFESLRAGALALRARCRIASGDLAGAESDLNEAEPTLLDPAVSPLFAGLQARAARWWEATAELRANRGEYHGAVEAWRRVVERRELIASLPQLSGPYIIELLARALMHLAEALARVEDTDDQAAQVRARAQALRQDIKL